MKMENKIKFNEKDFENLINNIGNTLENMCVNEIKPKQKLTKEDIIIKTENLIGEVLRLLETRLNTKINSVEIINGDYVDTNGIEKEGTRVIINDNISNGDLDEVVFDNDTGNDEFIFNLDGLIDGEYVNVQSESKKPITKILSLMDEAEE